MTRHDAKLHSWFLVEGLPSRQERDLESVVKKLPPHPHPGTNENYKSRQIYYTTHCARVARGSLKNFARTEHVNPEK